LIFPPEFNSQGMFSPRASSTASRKHQLKVTVLVEAVKHTFTPSVIQQFLALQSGLKTEISLLLESIAKFSEQRKALKVRPSTFISMESEYSFFLQGVSLRAKSSSQPVSSSSVWAEFGAGSIELKMSSHSDSKAPMRFHAKVSDLKATLLCASVSASGVWDEPLHALKAVSNVEVSNASLIGGDLAKSGVEAAQDLRSPRRLDDGQQSIQVVVSQTAVTVRPRFAAAFSRWYERYIKAIELYRSSRVGLEEVDLYAKKVWEKVTEAALDKDGKGRFKETRIGSSIYRVQVVNSSLLIPFVDDGNMLNLSVTTLHSLELLGPADTILEDAKLSGQAPPPPLSFATRLAKSDSQQKRRASFSAPPLKEDEATAKVSFAKPQLVEKKSWVFE